MMKENTGYWVNVTSGANCEVDIVRWFEVTSPEVEFTYFSSGSFNTRLYVASKGRPASVLGTSSWEWNSPYVDFLMLTPGKVVISWEDEWTYDYTFYGLYNETTGLRIYDNVTVTAYFVGAENASETFVLNGTYRYQPDYKPYYFHFALGPHDREYWVGDTEYATSIYVFNATDIKTYTISFVDLAGLLSDYPFVSARRYVNGTLRTVEKRKVDVEKKVLMSLVNGVKYDIEIANGASYVFGDLLMTSITTVQLTLKGLEFPERIILGYKYVRVYATRNMTSGTPIMIFYQDTLDQTNQVETKVYFQSNNSVAWTNTTSASVFIAYWYGSDNVTDYWCEVIINHGKFGIMSYRQVLPRIFTSNPWGLSFLGILPFATKLLIPSFIVLCVFGVFSSLNVPVGLFAGVVTATILAYIGWLPIGPEVLILAWAFAIIASIAYGKRRMYAA